MQNIHSFTELSISKLWNHFKGNQSIMKYMPDYESNQVTEKEFFFGVLSTVYPKETRDMVEAAYKARNTHYKKENDKMVELTPEVKKAIDSILSYKSKQVCLILFVATSGKALSLLKVKVSGKRKMNERFKFPVNLREFADPPRRIFRRIVPGTDNQIISLRRNRDQHMIDKEEEKKEDD